MTGEETGTARVRIKALEAGHVFYDQPVDAQEDVSVVSPDLLKYYDKACAYLGNPDVQERFRTGQDWDDLVLENQAEKRMKFCPKEKIDQQRYNLTETIEAFQNFKIDSLTTLLGNNTKRHLGSSKNYRMVEQTLGKLSEALQGKSSNNMDRMELRKIYDLYEDATFFATKYLYEKLKQKGATLNRGHSYSESELKSYGFGSYERNRILAMQQVFQVLTGSFYCRLKNDHYTEDQFQADIRSYNVRHGRERRLSVGDLTCVNSGVGKSSFSPKPDVSPRPRFRRQLSANN